MAPLGTCSWPTLPSPMHADGQLAVARERLTLAKLLLLLLGLDPNFVYYYYKCREVLFGVLVLNYIIP